MEQEGIVDGWGGMSLPRSVSDTIRRLRSEAPGGISRRSRVKTPRVDAAPGRAGRQMPRTVISANGFNTSPSGSVATTRLT